MRLATVLALMLVLLVVSSASGLEAKTYQFREDFGEEPLYDGALRYYYYIPCPTYSWFWSYTGWTPGDIVGAFFLIGDMSMGGYAACDPCNCQEVETIRVLDFAGYGTVYPGLFSVIFDIFCSDELGCPTGPSLWGSDTWELHFGWNYIPLDPPLCLTQHCCNVYPGPPPCFPRILITATMVGSAGGYPAWGMDNICTAVAEGCGMTDIGGQSALYPRPAVSHYGTIHSGYYGMGFTYCPPLWFCDGGDTTEDCSECGFIELAWTIYMLCNGPTATEPTTWGGIKSIYR
jgi:hypothetical protein